jgi:cell division protein FtsB
MRKNQKNDWPLRLFIIGTVIVVAYLAYTYANQVYRDYEINKQIEDAKNEIEDLKQENDQMTMYINYLRSDEFKEKKAKQILNLKNPDETVIIFEGADESILIEDHDKNENYLNELSPPEKWWEYFFGDLSLREG